MTTKKHTPLPWRPLNLTPERPGTSIGWSENTGTILVVYGHHEKEDAAFICRAVNSHYELLEALRNIINSDMAQREVNEGQISDVLTQAKAAIAKAEDK